MVTVVFGGVGAYFILGKLKFYDLVKLYFLVTYIEVKTLIKSSEGTFYHILIKI